jgi:hypothetical protein
MRSFGTSVNSFCRRQETSSSTSMPSGPTFAFACAIANSPSSMAERYSILSVTRPFSTRRYGVSRKPYWFVRAYTASELMRPMFGPSGVSIGHTRP